MLLRETKECGADVDDEVGARVWKIFNADSVNPITKAKKGYKLITNNRALALAHENSLIIRRAGFAKHSTWVVPYAEDELYAGGKYPNQNENPKDGVAQWVKRDESIVDEDIVVFHTFGFTHLPSVDEFPLMAMEYTSISLKPSNFFGQYIGLTVPPPPGHCDGKIKIPALDSTSTDF